MTDSEFAKTHLREHLGNLLVGPISEGFWSIYKSSSELCERNGQVSETLRTFQNMLTRIPEWSDSTLSTEVERIEKVSKCTYLDDLIMGVFIAYMKSFASLQYRGSSSEIKVDFDRPSLAKFIHELYKHSARKVWQIAYLFKTIGVSSEQQARNRQEIEKIISECMEQVIRGFLPWEAIAKKYFVQPKIDDIITAIPEQESQNSKTVSFGDSDSDSDDDDEEEEKLPIKLSEELASIEFNDLDEKEVQPEPTPKPEKELDLLDEISSKVGETLVLNL
jgi:hypothetical protein